MQELDSLDSIRLVVALRAARAAVGWSQEELALQLGIAKTTIARAELMEGGLRAEQLAQMVRLYRTLGVELDFMLGEDVTVKVNVDGLKLAQARLMDDARRRADRKKSAESFLIERLKEMGPGESK